MSLLAVQDLSRSFGGVVAVDTVNFALDAGRIVSIIGPNGAGKTTLFNLITGVYVPSAGRVQFDGRDVTDLPPFARAGMGLGRTFQNLQIFGAMTAIENVMVGRHRHEKAGLTAAMFGLPKIGRMNADARTRAMGLLDRVGLGQIAETRADSLAYGILKRLEIARALATEPKLLLLDEPAAGLNPTETREIDHLIQSIAGDGITVVLVEHDMKLVMGISERIIVLDHGRLLADGTPAEVRADPAVIRAYLGG